MPRRIDTRVDLRSARSACNIGAAIPAILDMSIIRRLIHVAVFFVLFSSFALVSHAQGQTSGEILVGFVDAATEEQADALIRSYGLTWESRFPVLFNLLVRSFAGDAEERLRLHAWATSVEEKEVPEGQPAGRYLSVQFGESVELPMAQSLIDEIGGLQVVAIDRIPSDSNAPKWGVVKVPAGEEDQWVNEFTRLVWNDPADIVRYAERNQIFGPLDQDQPRDSLPNGDVFQPQIVDAPSIPSFFALPLPALMFFAGGIVVALFIALVLIILFFIFFIRRKKMPELPGNTILTTQHVSVKKIVLAVLLFASVIGYLVLFRSPLKLSRDREDSGQTEVVGNVKTFQQFLASQTRRMAGGLLGNKNLCPNDDCSIPDRPAVETEQVTVALTGAQITDLVARFKPKSVLISNIQIQFEDGIGKATGTSFYPFIPGVVSVEATAASRRFRLEKGWLGQIPIPQRQYALINDGANYLIFSFLESIGVYVDEFDIVGNTIVATAQVPQGLIRVDGDTAIVNVDILTGSTGGGEIEVRTPTVPATPTESQLPDIPNLPPDTFFRN